MQTKGAPGIKTPAGQATLPSANLVASSSSTALAGNAGVPSPGAPNRYLAGIAHGKKGQPVNKECGAEVESKDGCE